MACGNAGDSTRRGHPADRGARLRGKVGSRYIVTVPGRGYEFVVPAGLAAEPAAMPAPAVPQPGTHNLPFATTRMIGREEAVATLVSRLSRERLVTVVGPGGIGKTT